MEACSHIYLSLYQENQRAEALYRKAGFEYNGEKDINGELVMVLPRERWGPQAEPEMRNIAYDKAK